MFQGGSKGPGKAICLVVWNQTHQYNKCGFYVFFQSRWHFLILEIRFPGNDHRCWLNQFNMGLPPLHWKRKRQWVWTTKSMEDTKGVNVFESVKLRICFFIFILLRIISFFTFFENNLFLHFQAYFSSFPASKPTRKLTLEQLH